MATERSDHPSGMSGNANVTSAEADVKMSEAMLSVDDDACDPRAWYSLYDKAIGGGWDAPAMNDYDIGSPE